MERSTKSLSDKLFGLGFTQLINECTHPWGNTTIDLVFANPLALKKINNLKTNDVDF